MGWRYWLQPLEVWQSHSDEATRFNIQAICLYRSYEPRTYSMRQAPWRVFLYACIWWETEERSQLDSNECKRLFHRRFNGIKVGFRKKHQFHCCKARPGDGNQEHSQDSPWNGNQIPSWRDTISATGLERRHIAWTCWCILHNLRQWPSKGTCPGNKNNGPGR